MVSRKASAPKRAAATQKLSKKAATATEKAKAKKKATTKTNAVAAPSKKQEAPASRADASALATTSGAADKHSDRGKVLYVGHLPHGFYEEQLRGYFSQFGAVTRVRLSRVKKTGKPKSYAFLEFANPAVAAIAADAMDGYLMFSQRLSVKVLAPEAVHPALFRGANRVFTKVPWRQLEAKRANRKLTPEGAARRRARAARADAKRAERIERSGVDYEYERLLESILVEEEEGPKAKKVAAAAAGGRKTKAPAAEAAEAAPAKKAKTAAAAEAPKATAAAAAAKKKPAAAKKASAPAVAAKKSKREPAASTAGTRSSKRARG